MPLAKMTEEWKDCFGYIGLYQVSNYGNIRCLDKLVWNGFGYVQRQGRMMKTQIDRYGYVRITLSKNGKKTNEQVHRLVALTFLDNSNNLPQVNHKDANKQNNFAGTSERDYTDGNLEWCTNAENMEHAHETIDFNYETIPVVKIDIDSNIVLKKYDSVKDAAKDVLDNPSNILKACNFDNDSAKGFRWRKNMDNAYEIGDHVELKKLYHPSTRKRRVVKMQNGCVISIYDSVSEAARGNNCIDSAIGMCCKGKIKQHHGFQWKYYEDYIND